MSYNDPFGLCVNSDDSKPNLLSQGLDGLGGILKWGTDKLTQGVDWIDLNVFGGQANIITAQLNIDLGAVQSLSFTAQGILTLAAHPVKTTANVLAIFEFDPVGAQIGRPIKIKDEVLLSAADAIGQEVEDFAAADANHKVRTTGFVVAEIAQFLIPITKASKAKYASEAGKTAEEMKYLGEASNLSKVTLSEMMDVSQLRLLQNMDVQQTTKYVEELKRLKETANATKAVKASTGLAEIFARLRFKPGYADHLKNVISFDRDATKGIVGGHNMTEFMNYFRNVEGLADAEFIVTKTPHPTINGIYEITYKVPLKDSAGNILPGQYKIFKNPKTVYDPSVFSDAEMLKLGEEAMKDAIINHTINGREVIGAASNGLRFKGFIDDSVTDAIEITNFFPIF